MGDAKRHAVIHGHFYQPPRENPWLESVPREPGAAPYHDWNERITAECYAANASSRRLDPAGRIAQVVNNYRRIAFNFGPTLIAYLERAAPETYAAILAADRDSAARLDGHGNAIAQAYNHIILPLASDRDKQTQVRWGLADFAFRFGRPAEGMWLPETVVDVATLEALAAEGVRFTVLAPHQALRVRALTPGRRPEGPADPTPAPSAERLSGGVGRTPPEIDAAGWQDVSGGRIDPRRPYLCRLPSGRTIALFFYDGPLARSVAFEGVLHSGDGFAERMIAAFDGRSEPQLVHLATDGESYGHHHRFGDMALAVALARLEEAGVQVTNHAAYLAQHPPEHEVEIAGCTAWSCAHGVERWRWDCGCRTGGEAGWNQAWRSGLRLALDALAAELDDWYAEQAGALVGDPWELRDDLGHALPDESRRALRELLERHSGRPLGAREATHLATLLESQRARLLMFTSCGWFFDELTGLEGTQVLRYAARAVELARTYGFTPSSAFLDHLASARSNRPGVGSGADHFRKSVLPEIVTCRQIALAGAVERLIGVSDGVVRDPPIAVELDPWLERATAGHASAEENVYSRAALGVAGIVVGLATVRDARTLDEQAFVVASARHGSFDVICAARPAPTATSVRVESEPLIAALAAAFDRRAHGTVVAEISRRLGPDFFGLDVLGLASRAAFFPALVADLEALVAARLVEFAPLARAIAAEAAEVGASVPPAIATVLGAARDVAGVVPPEADVRDRLLALEAILRRTAGPGALREAAGATAGPLAAPLGAVAEAASQLARIVRGERASPRAPRNFPTEDFVWWRLFARPGLDAPLLAALDPLRESLGFSPEAPEAAAGEAAFGALLRVVLEEVHAGHPQVLRDRAA